MKTPFTSFTKTNNEDTSSKLLLKENQELKEKIKQLEYQCKSFEKKVKRINFIFYEKIF